MLKSSKKYLEGGVMAFITGHACQTKISNSKIWNFNESRTMFLPFLPECSWTLHKFWKFYLIMVWIKYGVRILRTNFPNLGQTQ